MLEYRLTKEKVEDAFNTNINNTVTSKTKKKWKGTTEMNKYLIIYSEILDKIQ